MPRDLKLLVMAAVATLLGAPPAPAAPPAVQSGVRLVADNDFSATKDKYVAKAQETVDEWQRKINDAAHSTGAHAKATSDAAQVQLDEAWQKTQVEAKRLQATGADGWDRVKGAFEKASHDLSDAWSRAHPDSK